MRPHFSHPISSSNINYTAIRNLYLNQPHTYDHHVGHLMTIPPDYHSQRHINESYQPGAPFSARPVLHSGFSGRLGPPRPSHSAQSPTNSNHPALTPSRPNINSQSLNNINVPPPPSMMRHLHTPSSRTYTNAQISSSSRMPLSPPSNMSHMISIQQQQAIPPTNASTTDIPSHLRPHTRGSDTNSMNPMKNPTQVVTIDDMKTQTKLQKNSSAIISLSEEELNKEAISLQDNVAIFSEDIDQFSEGLRLQQHEWAEKSEYKRLLSEFFTLFRKLREGSKSTQDNGSVHDGESEVAAVKKTLQAIHRLKQRLQSSTLCLDACVKDIENIKERTQQQMIENQKLEQVNLQRAASYLERAKRRRLFEKKYERLAETILSKRSREACAKELEEESEKLEEVKKESKCWAQLNDLRKLQTDAVSAMVRTFLEVLCNTDKLTDLMTCLDNQMDDGVVSQTLQSNVQTQQP